MLGHTKERHAKNIELHLIGPANKKDKAMETLVSLGFTEVLDSIPWREAFPEASDQELIGGILVGVTVRLSGGHYFPALAARISGHLKQNS